VGILSERNLKGNWEFINYGEGGNLFLNVYFRYSAARAPNSSLQAYAKTSPCRHCEEWA